MTNTMLAKHFGKSLTQSWAQAERDGVIHFSQLAIPFLVEKAVDTIGVFSLTKDVNEVQRMKQLIDQGELVTFEQSAPHNVATLLKLYFTELPEALIPHEILSELNAIELKGSDQRTIEEIRVCILKMPYISQRLLQQMMDLCNLIAYNANKNKMSAENLSVVLLDAIARPKNIDSDPTRSELLIKYLIDNYKLIFDKEFMQEINKQKDEFHQLLQRMHIEDAAPSNNNNKSDNTIVIEGYLSKKGEKGLVKLWKRRYFQLRPDMRLYYSEDKNTPPLGNIDLYSVSEIKATGVAWGNERGLDIHSAGRVYQLSAPSAEQLTYWVDGLQRCLTDIRANPNRDHPFLQAPDGNQPLLQLEFVKIKAANDRYLSSDKSGTIVANKLEANEWEVWTLERDAVNPMKITLKNHNLKYLCAQLNGAAVANRNEAKDWEQWTLIYFQNDAEDNNNPKVALKSHHKTFLTVNLAKDTVRSDAREIKENELFLIEKLF